MPRFSPPGGLNDLTRDDHLQAWSDMLSDALDGQIRGRGPLFNPVTNPRPGLQPRRIPWIAMPQTVWDHRPRDEARAHVDDPANRQDAGVGQNEYAEWFTHRDTADGEVTGVDLTTELPEYFAFLAGNLSRTELGDVYRQLYPAALDDDLFDADGNYDPTNPWNTTRGTMHLIGAINTLPAALGVVGGAVGWRFTDDGRLMDAQDCVGQAGQFHADPSLLANLNRMSREGRAITLQDPIGIYIVDLDTSGWETPDGSDPRELITFSRGTPPMHARVTVPPGRGFRLCDVTMAGERIRWGSQIAERTVVGVAAAVDRPGEFTFTPEEGVPCTEAAPPGAGDVPVLAVVEETVVVIGRSVR